MDEKKVKTKKKSWGKPVKSEKQDGKELAQRLLGGGMTLVLTAVIIAAGFALPSYIYPYVDSFNNDFVQLENLPESTKRTTRQANEPIVYPWNTYDVTRLRSLYEDEVSKLSASGAVHFLISIMRDRGFPISQNENFYESKILADFQCLEPQVPGEPRFFVLYSEDLNADNTADFRCACDYDGKIIDWRLLSSEWESVRLTAPIDISSAQTGNVGDSGSTNATEGESDPDAGYESEGVGTANNDSDPTGGNQGGDQDESGGEVSETDTAENDSGPEGQGTTSSSNSITIYPNDEDRSIWSFSYSISREAYLFNQRDIFSAVRQLDIFYERKYLYQFNLLLPSQLSRDESIPNDALYSGLDTPDYLPFEDQYRLHIYRLSNGAQLILYINPITQACFGFNIQQYNPTASQA